MISHYLEHYAPYILMANLLSIHLFSKKSLGGIFLLLYRLTKSDLISSWLISLILLPGTLLHELIHFMVAKMLFLKITSFIILPERSGNGIKLGEVTFIRRDKISALIVGVSPLIGGICATYILCGILPENTIPRPIYFLILYLIFSITSTMFSSPEDLKESAVLIPVLFLILVVDLYFNTSVIGKLLSDTRIIEISSSLNHMMVLIIAIHITIYILSAVMNKFVLRY